MFLLADLPNDLKAPAKRDDLVKFFRDRTPCEQRVAWAEEQLEMLNAWKAEAGEDPLLFEAPVFLVRAGRRHDAANMQG
jgi:hypothetical protein